MDTRRLPAPPKRPSACPHASASLEHRAPSGDRRWVGHVLLALFLGIAAVTVADAGELEWRINDALALCAAADRLTPEEREPALARGLELADAALALDDRSARAHFAVVCNLGKATSLAGIGFRTFGAVYRLRREVDRTLTLAPDDPDALAAKGALLVKLPRWLGGDGVEARHWLRRALTVDPLNATARAYLDEIESRAGGVAPAADTAVTR